MPTHRLFFFNDTATTEIYTLSLHDALPISFDLGQIRSQTILGHPDACAGGDVERSEEHTSELQSLAYLVCRLLLEKKKTLLAHPARLQHRDPLAERQRRGRAVTHEHADARY